MEPLWLSAARDREREREREGERRVHRDRVRRQDMEQQLFLALLPNHLGYQEEHVLKKAQALVAEIMRSDK